MHLSILRKLVCFSVLSVLLITPLYASSKACMTAEQASRFPNKDICITAHVYDVVQLADGTRFLDICSPDTPDEQCRFTIVSAWSDRGLVGNLLKYRDMNVKVRGIIQPMHGRFGMFISHNRQFSGGPPRFRPNPRLVRGFGGDQDSPPLNDPNLRSRGSGRGFMNTWNREALPAR